MNGNVPGIKCAGLVIFRRTSLGDVEYLLLNSTRNPDRWGSPKGHLNEGETLLQAAIRETNEESGLQPDDYEILYKIPVTTEYMRRGKLKTTTFWLAEMKSEHTEIKLSHEHQNFRWVNSEIARQMTNDEFSQIITQTEEFLSMHGKN